MNEPTHGDAPKATRRILLTGFEPFGGEAINPAWEIARRLQGVRIDDADIVSVQLPCVFGESLAVLASAIRAHQPALVLALGQAGGRSDLQVERVAINVDDARIADNVGHQPVDQAVVAGGPAAYFSTLPIKAMVAAMREAGFPASVSQTAGTFVCNHVFYGLQHQLWQSGVRSGFMHIPYLPEQAARHPGQASMALDTMTEGIRTALTAAWRTQIDRAEGGGTIC